MKHNALNLFTMRTIKYLPIFLLLILTSCSSVRVNSDYDQKVNFEKYKTFAYLKSSIDKVEISDLDKKRILRSIDETMSNKGFNKSETPDMLISFFTKENQQVNVYNNNNFGWGWGWNPYWGTSIYYSSVSSYPEGTLYINILDANTKDLIWQGEGSGYLTNDTKQKDERIKEFATKILEQFPPSKN